jgi:hypothetical protein
MSRPYSDKFILTLNTLNPNLVGVKLGKLCVKANIPAIYVAEHFEVSRLSVFAWFRGGQIRNKNKTKVESFINMVEEGLEMGVLPAPTLLRTKEFLSNK